MEIRLSWQQCKAVFGKESLDPEDTLTLNGQVLVVIGVSADGVELASVDDIEIEEMEMEDWRDDIQPQH